MIVLYILHSVVFISHLDINLNDEVLSTATAGISALEAVDVEIRLSGLFSLCK